MTLSTRFIAALTGLLVLGSAAIADVAERLSEQVAVIETAWAEHDYKTLIDRQMDITIDQIAIDNNMSTETFRLAYPNFAKTLFDHLDPLLPYFDTDAASFVTLEDDRIVAIVPSAYVYGMNGDLLHHTLTTVWLLNGDDWRYAEVNETTTRDVILLAFPALTAQQLPFSDVEILETLPDWAGDQK